MDEHNLGEKREEHHTPNHPHTHEDEKPMTISFKKSSMWKAGTFIFAALFLIALFWNPGAGTSPTGNAVNPTPTPAPTAAPPTQEVKITLEDNDPVLGDKNAKISVIEFSDFQCPFCARAATDTLAGLKNSDAFKNGEVNVVYKQFPLNSIHPQAQKAGEASLCAQDQGKFWEYHDLLFENQRALDIPSLKSYAGQLSLNQANFDSCLDSGDKESEVNKETTQATSAGGRGTPYFVVYNTDTEATSPVSGAVPYAQLAAAIDAVK
jgi:protein-disulfide isomerase